ncbi:type 4a pilus biogenesis protein PilO [Modicisalibacter tunisiensis]|uniref:type 4a pilus biogenesis protein PilO n=1 Tax=Modicisalibacter tunisiensis TaxID=390637 RepID=UPI001CCA01E5|nr:type 4a pilus biogenesis protein PilO [Modicisalibacter tunisiensis]MBZ9540165.1 type 4a pilus biogenesis protein PilO [Modicisalibacter tunisiensis]
MRLAAEWRRLREVDWRELDLREAGNWPVSLQVLTCLLVGLVLFWLGYHFVAAPRLDRLEQARQQEHALLEQYETKAYQAANLPAMRRQMQTLETRMDTLLKMLPTGAEVPSLLDDISDTARQHHLTIDVIRLQAPVEKAYYIEQPFSIQVEGDYHRIAVFLSGVAALPRIVTLHDFTLTPVDDQGTLKLSMLAKTYNHRAQAAAGDTASTAEGGS